MSKTNTPSLNTVLAIRNLHERDNHIQFFEKEHTYLITDDIEHKYTSVTNWNSTQFEIFDADKIIQNMMNGKKWKKGHKYWNLTPEQIKNQWDTNKNTVTELGTNLHYEIECFLNNTDLKINYTNTDLYNYYMTAQKSIHNHNPSIEWTYFINFIKDFPTLKPFRTEWRIYDERIKIAGTIDVIYENPDQTYSIYDWKRSKNITRINDYNKFSISPLICHIPDSNFWHYALQLNIYKTILEQNYNIKIKELFLVRLHPNSSNYELILLPNLTVEMNDLFSEKISIIDN